jgi:hypothetical protein
MSWCFVMPCYCLLEFNQMTWPTRHTVYKYKNYFFYVIQNVLDCCIMSPLMTVNWLKYFFMLYSDQQMHNYLTNYHTPTCFDTIMSSSDSLQSIPCQVTPVFHTMTNKCTINSQIITLLHVSTLSCHSQGACNQCLAKLHKHFKCSSW